MTDPVNFTSQTPRFGLPILFSGQAQKEFYLNEAHALIDSLMHPVVEGTFETAPEDPQPGECWIVGDDANGDWFDHGGEIACFQSGMWLFGKPVDGMRIFDRSTGTMLFYRNGWAGVAPVHLAEGGATVDAEARAAIAQLVQALTTAGLFPAS